MLVESAVDATLQVVRQRTLFELKQINFVAAYRRRAVARSRGYAVEERAGRINVEYRRKLHEVDKIAGWRCTGPRWPNGNCAYQGCTQAEHPAGGGEKFFFEQFGEVQPLVFGHFGELNERFHKLIHNTAVTVAALYNQSLRALFARASL